MIPRLPRTALQDFEYAQHAFDCSDYNLIGLLRASIRRKERYRDLRSPEYKLRYRDLVEARVEAKRWMAHRRLNEIKQARPSRRLMLVGERK